MPLPKPLPLRSVLSAGMLVLIALAAPALPAVAAGLTVELNKLEAQGEDCRAYLVFENGTDSAFTALKLDLVLFDADGVVARRLAVEGAPLPAGKTVVRLFDIGKLACGRIGRVLLNDVIACAGAAGGRDDCLAIVEPRSRTPAGFVK